MSRKTISVAIVDDSDHWCQQAEAMLNESPYTCSITTCDAYQSALNGIAQASPDLLIVELAIRQGNGMEFIRKMRLTQPELLMLAFSHQDEQLYAERALRVGAHGYVMKGSPPELFQSALERILNGELFVSPRIEAKILRSIAGSGLTSDEPDPERLLSNRELEVFVKIGQGASSRDIAQQLALSIKTVETHRAHIKRKLNTPTATALVHCAAEWVETTQPA